MFYASNSENLFSKDSQAVAFESKKRRDQFCADAGFVAVDGNKANAIHQAPYLRVKPEVIRNFDGNVVGYVKENESGLYIESN